MRRTLVIAAIAALSLVAAPAAHAVIWTPVSSGTTETITALDYRADKTVFGTSNGHIFTLAGGQRASFPGLSVIDLKLNPSGTTAVAVLTGGKVTRSTDGGTTWGAATQLTTYNTSFECQASPSVALTALAQDPTAIGWASDTTAYISDSLRGSMQKTANGGLNWAESSRTNLGACKLDSGFNSPITDIAPVVGSDSVSFIGQSFGRVWFSSDALLSSPSQRGESVNCFDGKPSLAVDTGSSNRFVAGDRCNDGLSLQYSEDGGNTFARPNIAPDSTRVNGEYDVSFVGGTAIWAGNGGDIFTSNDGRTAYAQKADGVNAARDWRTVSAYSASNAAVGGAGGALATTTSANTIPDLVAPAGTIVQPGTVTAGVPTQFTVTATDNAGGSGVDPASFVWTATGVPAATGNPASITFPAAGENTLTVNFKDRAGNAASATLNVTVVAGETPTPGGRSTGSVPGATLTLQGPKACVTPGVPFKATMSMKRSKKKGNKVVKLSAVDFYIDGVKAKTDKKAPFVQRLVVGAAAPGTTHKLKARGTIKVRRGVSPKKSVTVTFRVCS